MPISKNGLKPGCVTLICESPNGILVITISPASSARPVDIVFPFFPDNEASAPEIALPVSSVTLTRTRPDCAIKDEIAASSSDATNTLRQHGSELTAYIVLGVHGTLEAAACLKLELDANPAPRFLRADLSDGESIG
jgi:hypothetical protein